MFPKEDARLKYPSMALLNQRQQKLRARPTKHECIFRDRLIASAIPFKFQAIVGFYIPDFILTDNSVIVEIDGASHKDAVEYDARRDSFLRDCGFEVVRIPNAAAATYDLGSLTSIPARKSLGSCLGTANGKRGAIINKMQKAGAVGAYPDKKPQPERQPRLTKGFMRREIERLTRLLSDSRAEIGKLKQELRSRDLELETLSMDAKARHHL